MFCRHCGNQVPESAKFCGGCGQASSVASTPKEKPSEPAISIPGTLTAAPPPIAAAPPITAAPEGPPPGTSVNSPPRTLMGIAVAIVVIVILAVVVVLARRSPGEPPVAVNDKAPSGEKIAPARPAPAATASGPAHVATPQPVIATASGQSECFDIAQHQPRSLDGKLVGTIFPDRPEFTDVRKGDDPVAGYVLKLQNSICIRSSSGGDDGADPSVRILEVQLAPADQNAHIEGALRSLVGFDVHVEFASAQGAMTAHDQRPLVGLVNGISPRDTPAAGTVVPRIMTAQPYTANEDSEVGTPATTVRGFYYALGLGNGESAADFIIPEKRSSGPFAADSITHYYGPMAEPVRVIDLKPQGANEFLVTYSYGSTTHHCQSHALVTTTQRDGLNLIEKIHQLDGCESAASRDTSTLANGKKSNAPNPIRSAETGSGPAAAMPTSMSNSTPVHMDPRHPLRIGEDYYPEASKRANEEGRCVVHLTVTADGQITNETLETSSGYPRLDEACLKAVHGQRLLPATEGGRPVTVTVSIPIVWSLSDR